MKGNWVEICRSAITLKEKLGEGAFGEAYKGLVRMDGKVRECAVKKLKGKDYELSICQSRNWPVYLLTELRTLSPLFFKTTLTWNFRIITSKLLS